jgi:hypothetical protein
MTKNSSKGAARRSAASRALSFDLDFRPSSQLITIVRQFVVSFFETTMGDADTASRLAVVTHELLENAVKYSKEGAAKLSVGVDDARRTVDVRVYNRATQPQIAKLRAHFAEIHAAKDAQGHYVSLLHRSARVKVGSGGLGLARIWAEGDMTLRLSVAGDRVQIHARGVTAPVA